MNLDNIVLSTDSYKLSHHGQYPEGTTGVYSYFEARAGAMYPETVFFGLQHILLNQLEGARVTARDIEEAASLAAVHFGDRTLFNRVGWQYILDIHAGRLPIRIKAVPEGSVVPTGNVLMTVENTDPNCAWLTNALESLLVHVWYPTTVASKSRHVKKILNDYLARTAESADGLQYMLHDFGYRGATTHDAAALGGASHLVNFVGTDTLPALLLAANSYVGDLTTLGFSVPATEHSVMTALGKDGELNVVDKLIDQHPAGILSVVADSYDVYAFVSALGEPARKAKILARDGVFVVRPDSITRDHPTPEHLTAALLEQLWNIFSGTTNSKGYRVLDSHVRVLWGDGIDDIGIEEILDYMERAGFSAENIVFGMGGGLLQKVNRDTQRFAFKCAAQQRGGAWVDIQKDPLDKSKASKAGRLKLVRNALGHFLTVSETDPLWEDVPDELEVVFDNGSLVGERQTFEEIRARAQL